MGTLSELAGSIETTTGPLPESHRAALFAVDRRRFVRAADRSLAYENLALPRNTPASRPALPVADIPEAGRLLAPVGPPLVPQRYLLHRRERGELVVQGLGFSVFFIPDRQSR